MVGVILFVVEVILVIIAWKAGWGWKALLPSCIALFLALTTGMIFGMVGIDLSNNFDLLTKISLTISVFTVGVLLVMIRKAKTA